MAPLKAQINWSFQIAKKATFSNLPHGRSTEGINPGTANAGI